MRPPVACCCIYSASAEGVYKRRVDKLNSDTEIEVRGYEDELLAAALAARGSAYCPYSSFAVGAALMTSDGRIFSGCNVENASYGLTVCAERNALFAAVAGGMRPGELAMLALVGGPLAEQADSSYGTELTITPCGACRQVLAEFAAPDCIVLAVDASGAAPAEDALEVAAAYRMSELLPFAFGLQ
ncbi:cytidine deaminase [bacterium]|nr:cytidine deaminase [bacterium]